MYCGTLAVHFALMFNDIDLNGQLHRRQASIELVNGHIARVAKEFPWFAALWTCTATTDLRQKLIIVDCHVLERISMVMFVINHNLSWFHWIMRMILYHIQLFKDFHSNFGWRAVVFISTLCEFNQTVQFCWYSQSQCVFNTWFSSTMTTDWTAMKLATEYTGVSFWKCFWDSIQMIKLAFADKLISFGFFFLSQ